MKEIKIKTQKQFDKLPKTFKEYTHINIIKDINIISYTPDNSYISVSGSAVVKSVSGSAVVKSVSGSAVVESVSGSAVVEYVSGSAVVKYVSGSAVVKYVSGNSIVKILSDSVKINNIGAESTIVLQGCDIIVGNIYDNATIVKHKKAKYSINEFINRFNVEKTDNGIILYKIVNDNYKDHWTNTVNYKTKSDIVKCPDWLEDNTIECGNGLHLSPSVHFCKQFNNKGIALKCEVLILDSNGKPNILVHENPDSPQKVRCKKIRVIEDLGRV